MSRPFKFRPRLKPRPWNVSPAQVTPEWRTLWNPYPRCVCPLWEGGGAVHELSHQTITPLAGALSWVQTEDGIALDCPGSVSDFIDIPLVPSHAYDAGTLVYRASHDQSAIGRLGAHNDMEFLLRTNGSIWADVCNNGQIKTGGSIYTANRFHTIVGIWNKSASFAALYLDGSFVKGTTNLVAAPTPTALRIGSSPSTTQELVGRVSFAGLWDYAWPPELISRHAQDPWGLVRLERSKIFAVPAVAGPAPFLPFYPERQNTLLRM